ncbi:MAG: DUF1294 domain-containing protein [Clostridia bacterium]|nr:DUF1294 domain-containing protein [Clostridia bacterium]
MADIGIKIFTIQNVIIYLLIINVIAFLAMWIDKRKAEKGKWRISETTLLLLGVLGGSIGSMIGMYTFRHKTKKKRFTIGMPAILIIEIIIYFIYFI